MGWNVDVDFKPSALEGTGAFARSPIKAGTKVWSFDETMHVCGLTDLATLSPEVLKFALHGGYLHEPSDRFVWYADGMHFVNHGLGIDANIGITEWTALEDDNCTALRDIAAGEELLEDYTFWSAKSLDTEHWLTKLYLDFHPAHFEFLLAMEDLRQARSA